LKIKTKVVSGHTANSKPVKQEVNCTVILPPLVFPGKRDIDRQSDRWTDRREDTKMDRHTSKWALVVKSFF
jgi:hypothetical protein